MNASHIKQEISALVAAGLLSKYMATKARKYMEADPSFVESIEGCKVSEATDLIVDLARVWKPAPATAVVAAAIAEEVVEVVELVVEVPEVATEVVKVVPLAKQTVEQLATLYSNLLSDYAEARDCGGKNVRALSTTVRWVRAELARRGIEVESAADSYAAYLEAGSNCN